MARASNRMTAALRRQARHGTGTRFASAAAPLWQVAPAAVRRRLRGETGRRFLRFVPVSAAAAITTLVVNAVLLGPVHLTAGLSGGLSAMSGAAVSYVLSRWAWERRGRPHLLKETLPFWLVSVGAWVALGLADKLGVHIAAALGLAGAPRVLVAEGVYFLANCLTFLARFAVFHYVLFARPAGPSASAGAAGRPGSRPGRSVRTEAVPSPASPASAGKRDETAVPAGERFVPAGE
jgi:putative flippase GtrA